MSDELQTLCYLLGNNSIILGERLLATSNPMPDDDSMLFARLGLRLMGDIRELYTTA